MIFDDIYSMCLHYYFATKSGDKLTETNTINGVNITFNIYKLPSNYTFSSNNQMSTLMNLCGAPGYGQVIIGDYITVNSGITLSPPYRCKGFYIFCKKLTNNGTISMTQRGSEDWGQNVFLWKDQYVPATGASGGASRYISGNKDSDNTGGISGSSAPYASRMTGGGGSGTCASGNTSRNHTTGAGSAGTSWSGGLGGGGLCWPGASGTGNSANTITGWGGTGSAWKNGSNGAGCYGGTGCTIHGYSSYGSDWGGNSKKNRNPVYHNSNAQSPAGMMSIYAKNIYNYSITSVGGSAGSGHSWWTALGGGGGGGSINLFYSNCEREGSVSVAPGGGGSSGGWGSSYWYRIPYYDLNNALLTILLEGPSGDFSNAIYKNEHITFDTLTDFYNIVHDYEMTFNEPVYLYDRSISTVEDYYNTTNIKIIIKYYRRKFNVTVTNGFSSKNPYRWGEITKIYYKNSSNNPLVKFKNWKTDDVDVELPISIGRICNFVMPLHNVSISAEFEDQDRFNSNIYKDMFEKEIFELYDRLNNKYLLDLLTQKNNTVFQMNHNLDLYDLVYLNENGVYKKGLATEEKYQVLGIVSEIINENEFVLTLYGPIDYDYNFESDSGILYLSDSVEGAFCSYEDITTAFYTPIGYYKNNQIVINILDSSMGRELKLYQDELFKDITFNYITENDINDIVTEVISKENRIDEVEPETPDEPEEPEEPEEG